ncbi:MAG: NAD(P)/FAD-dependent oxidoreductase [Crocinitomicaceae bacterium]
MRVAIIGGGAGGFFSAIHVKENHPSAEVVIFEKSKRVLSKVKISGGGRCNVTNSETSIKLLSDAYPRGNKKLKQAFTEFSTQDCQKWFTDRGVPLVTQSDHCVFPESQSSQSIIDCFMAEVIRLNIEIKMSHKVKELKPLGEVIALHFDGDEEQIEVFDKVIVATGGSPKNSGLLWLERLGHKIENPVPSLFTFNMPNEGVTTLMGIVVENAKVSIQSTKLKSEGPLLLTHWGMSGPAILKLSAFGARILEEFNYNFKIQVNWVDELNNEVVAGVIRKIIEEHPAKHLKGIRPFGLPERLWVYLLEKSDLDTNKKWPELGKKGLNKLVNVLTNDIYQVEGKTTFKDEFVTCGGVSLESIDCKTMQSKVVPNLYFTGEVMDIDGITGGYNFQSAWTTAYIAAKLG